MSNTNNPFLPYLKEENNKNDNDNQNNSKAKSDNDISKILEEGSATAVPPPAYDEIAKPQPTQPGFDYPSYPPPPFSTAPGVQVQNENYNQSPNVYMNSNNGKRGNRICCSGGSRRNKTCGCGWIIVLIIFIILGTISIINNNACSNITLGGNPEKLTFDPSTSTIFKINTNDARIKKGEVRIFQQPPKNGLQSVDVDVYTGSTGINPKIESSSNNGVFELKISQPGFSIFNIPPRCMKSQINIYLPSILVGGTSGPSPNTIQVNNLDVTMMKNDLPYQQTIKLVSNDGDITLNDVNAQNLIITTNDGDIFGTVTTISNELNITTNDGDLDLTLGSAQFLINSKLSILTDDGDVSLKFDGSSFSGNYAIRSDDGRILVQNNEPTRVGTQIVGRVGDGTGNLNIETDNGDVRLIF